jgi:hypothetical protein
MLAVARRAARESVGDFYGFPGVGPRTGQPQANVRNPFGVVSMSLREGRGGGVN